MKARSKQVKEAVLLLQNYLLDADGLGVADLGIIIREDQVTLISNFIEDTEIAVHNHEVVKGVNALVFLSEGL